MDDEPRIVVSLQDEATSPNRIVVAIDTEPTDHESQLDPRPVMVEIPQEESRRRHRGLITAIIVLLFVAAGAFVGWAALHNASASPDPHTVALPADPSDAAKSVAILQGSDNALVELVRDATVLSNLHIAAECRSFAALRLEPLGGPAAMLQEVQSLPSSAIRGALTNVLDATTAQLLRCESDASTATTSNQLQFAAVVAQRVLEHAGVDMHSSRKAAQ